MGWLSLAREACGDSKQSLGCDTSIRIGASSPAAPTCEVCVRSCSLWRYRLSLMIIGLMITRQLIRNSDYSHAADRLHRRLNQLCKLPLCSPVFCCVSCNVTCFHAQVMGIMNGTTNYMLSRMASEGAEYGEVLQEAQALGYAEGA